LEALPRLVEAFPPLTLVPQLLKFLLRTIPPAKDLLLDLVLDFPDLLQPLLRGNALRGWRYPSTS
jgi:hypothetical protein